MLKHSSPISGISVHSDKYVATAGYDNRVILWDVKTHKTISIGMHDHLVNQCEFSPCGNYLVTSSSDYTARLWQLPQMKLLTVFHQHEDDVEMSTIHPTESLIATASRDYKVRIFDFTGNLIQTLEGHVEDVISVRWINDTKSLISSSDDGTIRVWNVETGKEINRISNNGIQTDALAISSEGMIFAGDDAGIIHVIDHHQNQKFMAHQAGIKRLIYSSIHKKLISTSYDRKARIWNVMTDGELKKDIEFSLPNIIWARSCAFLSDHAIVFATFGDSYAIYDYRNQEWHLDHIKPTRGINAVYAINNDIWTVGDAGIVHKNKKPISKLPSLCNFIIAVENLLITGGQSGELFDAKSGEVIYQHHSPLNCGATYFLHGKWHVVIGTYTGQGIILKFEKNALIFDRIIQLHDNAIKGVAVNNFHILFSVCATGAAAWHNLTNDHEEKFNRSAHLKIADACITLSGEHFSSVSRDLFLRIWDGKQFSLLEEIKTPHLNSMKCIAVDSSMRFIATGSYTGTVAVYDQQSSQWSSHLLTRAGISSLCYDEINHQFIAGSYDGNVYHISHMN